MKNFVKTIAVTSAAMALQANAVINVSDTQQTSFEIAGNIQPQCKITNTATALANTLNLASSEAQNVASIEIWCNTGQNNANTTYSSNNAGVLKNATHSGRDIAYLLDVSETQNGLNLATDQTVSQTSGIGINGETIARTIAIRPQVNGFEYEGTYSDTISVTVSIN